jgi:hypothetical protein
MLHPPRQASGAGGRSHGGRELADELAEQLFLSVCTVETHRAHIERKLGLTPRAELVRLCAGARVDAALMLAVDATALACEREKHDLINPTRVAYIAHAGRLGGP